jgi:hypothetical protein
MDLIEVRWKVMDWIYLAGDGVAGSCKHDNKLPDTIKCREFLDR